MSLAYLGVTQISLSHDIFARELFWGFFFDFILFESLKKNYYEYYYNKINTTKTILKLFKKFLGIFSVLL